MDPDNEPSKIHANDSQSCAVGVRLVTVWRRRMSGEEVRGLAGRSEPLPFPSSCWAVRVSQPDYSDIGSSVAPPIAPPLGAVDMERGHSLATVGHDHPRHSRPFSNRLKHLSAALNRAGAERGCRAQLYADWRSARYSGVAPGEFHPQPLLEPYVKLSLHTALDAQPPTTLSGVACSESSSRCLAPGLRRTTKPLRSTPEMGHGTGPDRQQSRQ
jgi:hypothetical protein